MTDFFGRVGDNLKALWKSMSAQFVTLSMAVWALVDQGLMTLPSFVTSMLNEHATLATVIWLVAFYVAKVMPQGGLFK